MNEKESIPALRSLHSTGKTQTLNGKQVNISMSYGNKYCGVQSVPIKQERPIGNGGIT